MLRLLTRLERHRAIANGDTQNQTYIENEAPDVSRCLKFASLPHKSNNFTHLYFVGRQRSLYRNLAPVLRKHCDVWPFRKGLKRRAFARVDARRLVTRQRQHTHKPAQSLPELEDSNHGDTYTIPQTPILVSPNFLVTYAAVPQQMVCA